MSVDLIATTVAHRNVEAETCWSFSKLYTLSRINFVWVVQAGDALIGRGRSVAIHQFLKMGAPYLLFVDSDIIFEPEDAEKIYWHLKSGYDLIGGTYAVRGGTQLAHYGLDEGRITMDGKVHEVDYLSTGFMGISKKLMEKMINEIPLPLVSKGLASECYPFFESGRYDHPKAGPIYISEDWDFCEKARKVGVKPYLDTSVRLGHKGAKIYYPKDVYDYQKGSDSESRQD